MKILIYTLLCIVFFAQGSIAQESYYPQNSGLINMDNYSYKYNLDNSLGCDKELYNADAVYHGVIEIGRKDGRIESYEEITNSPSGINGANYKISYIEDLIKSKFSDAQINLVKQKDYDLGIILTFNTTTGKVADVVFSFPLEGNWEYIPIEVYRSVELAIKPLLIFDVNDHGKQYNYGRIFWYVKFS